MPNLVNQPHATSVPTNWKLVMQAIDAMSTSERRKYYKKISARRRQLEAAMKEIAAALAQLNKIAEKPQRKKGVKRR